MSDWTVERVLALAPDPASVGPARELSNTAKWVSFGSGNQAVWGEAKGSGANPYQVAVDFNGPAFKCSCPSRKIPCKHVLGLLLRFANEQPTETSKPDWVSAWLDKRQEQGEKKQQPKAEPNPEATAKRADNRWQTILAGLDECEAFLIDVAGQGLLAAQSARSWDQMAARMVDAQAPGVARTLKGIGSRIGVGTNWGGEVAANMGSLALLIEASKRLPALSEANKADVRSTLGIPTRKEDLSGEHIQDVWDILGQAVEIEDRLTVYRSWLRGCETDRWAMHLSYSAAGQAPELRLVPGTAIVANLQFHPSAWPMRAQLDSVSAATFHPRIEGTWDETLDRSASALAANPWLEHMPASLSEARLGHAEGAWWIIDKNGAAMQAVHFQPWQTLALTGNQPFDIFGELAGRNFRPLGAWGSWGYLPL